MEKIITYLAGIAKSYPTQAKLASKIGGTTNWVLAEKKTEHPLWKYAAILQTSGHTAKDQAIKADIARFAPQIFNGAAIPAGKTSTIGLLQGNTEASALTSAIIPKDSPISEQVSKLPTIGDIVRGAGAGIGDVLAQSEAGQEVKQNAIHSWFQENLPLIGLGVLGVVVAVLSFILFMPKKKKYKSKRRR